MSWGEFGSCEQRGNLAQRTRGARGCRRNGALFTADHFSLEKEGTPNNNKKHIPLTLNAGGGSAGPLVHGVLSKDAGLGSAPRLQPAAGRQQLLWSAG